MKCEYSNTVVGIPILGFYDAAYPNHTFILEGGEAGESYNNRLY